MRKKTASAITLTLLLTSMLALAFSIQPVKAGGTVYIRADGSIDPPDAPISTVDNVTYALTGNITSDSWGVVVERSNAIIDGAGYTVEVTEIGMGNGFYLSGISNVTIKNTNIRSFFYGIYLYYSSHNSIYGNDIANNAWGIYLEGSSGNSISGNNITANNNDGIELFTYSTNNSISVNSMTANNHNGIALSYYASNNSIIENNIMANKWDGISLSISSDNTITGNNITANTNYGISLYYSFRNSVSGSNITNNGHGFSVWAGIGLSESSSNIFYHNNLVDNAKQVYDYSWDYPKIPSVNIWDDGFPSGGNYWSDYTDIDANGDGIGDTPYVIDANNQDRYSLMHPWSSLPVHNINTGLGYDTIQEAISANETLDGHAIFVEAGRYYENIVVNKSLSLIGQNKEATIIDGSGIGTVVGVFEGNITLTGFTVQNTRMGYYDSGIYLYNYSGNNTFDGNKIVNCYQGIFLWKSSGSNIIKSNIIANNGFGIVTSETDSDVIIRNNVTSNGEGIWINRGTNISIIQNSIVCNHLHGIRIDTNDNIVYHNNIIDNEVQAGVSTLPPASNVWDDGYPSGGNYWSDYVGVDVKRGPNQDLPGSDGLGDTPYIIDASNTDHYPLFVGAPPPPTYSLTITTTVGGTTDPVPGTYSYSANSSVQVTAIPNADYTFDHWELDTATINVYMGISYDPNYTGGVLVTSIAPGGPADKAGLIVGDVIKEIDSLQVNHAEDLIIYVERHKNPGDTVVLRINRNNLIIQITLTLERPPVGSPNPHSVLMDSNHILRALFTRTSMPAAPVGGYSLQIRVQTKTEPVLSYIALTAALAAIVTGLRPKTKRKC